MKIDFKVTFTREEILQLCVQRCQNLYENLNGTFEAEFGLYGSNQVVCTFEPAEAEPIESDVPF